MYVFQTAQSLKALTGNMLTHGISGEKHSADGKLEQGVGDFSFTVAFEFSPCARFTYSKTKGITFFFLKENTVWNNT